MNSIRLSILIAGILAFATACASTAQQASEAPEAEKAPVEEEAAAAKKDGVTVEYSDRIMAELAERKLRIGEPVDRILQHSINGWNRLDNQHLILTVRVSDKYLVRLNRYCRGLEHNESVEFSTVGSDLTSMDQIRVHGSLGVDTCNITEIRKLEKVEEEEEERA